jgi:hypothetical protein
VPRTVPVSVCVRAAGHRRLPCRGDQADGAAHPQPARRRLRRPLERVALAGPHQRLRVLHATPQEYDVCQYEGSFTLFGREQGARFRDIASGLVKKLGRCVAPPAAGGRRAALAGDLEREAPAPRSTPGAAGPCRSRPAPSPATARRVPLAGR